MVNIGVIFSRLKILVRMLASFATKLWTFCVSCSVLMTNYRILKNASQILLVYEGGFGHSIIAPDLLRRRYPEGNLVVLFAYNPDRHNRLIDQVWESRLHFIWIPVAIKLPLLSLMFSVEWAQRLFLFLTSLVSVLAKKPEILSYAQLHDEAPHPPWVKKNSLYWHRYESRYHFQIITTNLPSIKFPKKFSSPIRTALSLHSSFKFKKLCNLYLRMKSNAPNLSYDQSSTRRQSANIEAYEPAIKFLNEIGFQVLLTGDTLVPDEMKSKYGDGLLDWVVLGVDREAYMIFSGTEVDMHIGSLSGGSAYVYATDIPTLVVDGFTFAEGLPYSTMHYKRLRNPDGRPVMPKELFSSFAFDFECTGYELIDSTPSEIKEAVKDFVENHESQRPYGIEAKDAGIVENSEWLKTANARISPVWLSSFETFDIELDNI